MARVLGRGHARRFLWQAACSSGSWQALAGFAAWPLPPEPEVRPVTQVTLPLTPAERLAPAAPQGRPTDNALTLSRDGRTVIFAGERGSGDSAERMLYRRSLDEAVATPIAGSEGASGAFLSPDGASVAFVAQTPRCAGCRSRVVPRS